MGSVKELAVELFQMLDTDKDRKLSREEILQVYSQMSQEEQCFGSSKSFFGQLDFDDNHQVTLLEWSSYCQSMVAVRGEESIARFCNRMIAAASGKRPSKKKDAAAAEFKAEREQARKKAEQAKAEEKASEVREAAMKEESRKRVEEDRKKFQAERDAAAAQKKADEEKAAAQKKADEEKAEQGKMREAALKEESRKRAEEDRKKFQAERDAAAAQKKAEQDKAQKEAEVKAKENKENKPEQKKPNEKKAEKVIAEKLYPSEKKADKKKADKKPTEDFKDEAARMREDKAAAAQIREERKAVRQKVQEDLKSSSLKNQWQNEQDVKFEREEKEKKKLAKEAKVQKQAAEKEAAEKEAALRDESRRKVEKDRAAWKAEREEKEASDKVRQAAQEKERQVAEEQAREQAQSNIFVRAHLEDVPSKSGLFETHVKLLGPAVMDEELASLFKAVEAQLDSRMSCVVCVEHLKVKCEHSAEPCMLTPEMDGSLASHMYERGTIIHAQCTKQDELPLLSPRSSARVGTKFKFTVRCTEGADETITPETSYLLELCDGGRLEGTRLTSGEPIEYFVNVVLEVCSIQGVSWRNSPVYDDVASEEGAKLGDQLIGLVVAGSDGVEYLKVASNGLFVPLATKNKSIQILVPPGIGQSSQVDADPNLHDYTNPIHREGDAPEASDEPIEDLASSPGLFGCCAVKTGKDEEIDYADSTDKKLLRAASGAPSQADAGLKKGVNVVLEVCPIQGVSWRNSPVYDDVASGEGPKGGELLIGLVVAGSDGVEYLKVASNGLFVPLATKDKSIQILVPPVTQPSDESVVGRWSLVDDAEIHVVFGVHDVVLSAPWGSPKSPRNSSFSSKYLFPPSSKSEKDASAGELYFVELDVKQLGYLEAPELLPLAKWTYYSFGGKKELPEKQLQREANKLATRLSAGKDGRVLMPEFKEYYELRLSQLENINAKKAAKHATQTPERKKADRDAARSKSPLGREMDDIDAEMRNAAEKYKHKKESWKR